MAYLYEIGAVRWKRWTGDGDVRCYRARKGWGNVTADLYWDHPTTGRPFRNGGQWWIREMFVGRD